MLQKVEIISSCFSNVGNKIHLEGVDFHWKVRWWVENFPILSFGRGTTGIHHLMHGHLIPLNHQIWTCICKLMTIHVHVSPLGWDMQQWQLLFRHCSTYSHHNDKPVNSVNSPSLYKKNSKMQQKLVILILLVMIMVIYQSQINTTLSQWNIHIIKNLKYLQLSKKGTAKGTIWCHKPQKMMTKGKKN